VVPSSRGVIIRNQWKERVCAMKSVRLRSRKGGALNWSVEKKEKKKAVGFLCVCSFFMVSLWCILRQVDFILSRTFKHTSEAICCRVCTACMGWHL